MVHLRSRISQCFSSVRVSHMVCALPTPSSLILPTKMHLAMARREANDKKSVFTQCPAARSAQFLSAMAFMSLSQITSLSNYSSCPCFCPINWWIKSSPTVLVFTNFTKSTAVATTFKRNIIRAGSMQYAISTKSKTNKDLWRACNAKQMGNSLSGIKR